MQDKKVVGCFVGGGAGVDIWICLESVYLFTYLLLSNSESECNDICSVWIQLSSKYANS